MNPNAKELTELAIDVQLANVWAMMGSMRLDEESLSLIAGSCRLAYVRGYHDGDALDIYGHSGRGADFNNEDVDLRLIDVWADIFESSMSRALEEIVVDLLRCAYCRGFLDAADTRPFGPAPVDEPDGLCPPASL